MAVIVAGDAGTHEGREVGGGDQAVAAQPLQRGGDPRVIDLHEGEGTVLLDLVDAGAGLDFPAEHLAEHGHRRALHAHAEPDHVDAHQVVVDHRDERRLLLGIAEAQALGGNAALDHGGQRPEAVGDGAVGEQGVRRHLVVARRSRLGAAAGSILIRPGQRGVGEGDELGGWRCGWLWCAGREPGRVAEIGETADREDGEHGDQEIDDTEPGTGDG